MSQENEPTGSSRNELTCPQVHGVKGPNEKGWLKRKSGPTTRSRSRARFLPQLKSMSDARTSGRLGERFKGQLLLARATIAKKHFEGEAELLQYSFVPYRYMSCYERTAMLAREFDKNYRNFAANHFALDYHGPARRWPSSWSDGEMSALWQVRQQADLLGMPYDFFVRSAFEACFRMGYRRCPQPNHLLQERVLKAVEADFEKQGGRTARQGYDPTQLEPMFFAENYRGDPIQDAAHKDLLDKSQQFPDFFKLGGLIWRDKIVPERVAREQLGDANVDRALDGYIQLHEREVSVSPGVATNPKPGCFGIHSIVAEPCKTCPVAEDCSELKLEVDAALVAKFGTDDPHRARMRADATERKRRQRKREREARDVRLLKAGEADGIEAGRQ